MKTENVRQQITDALNSIKKEVDYCSGVKDYYHMKPCCKNHDNDYAEQIGKWKADWQFFKCGWANSSIYYPESNTKTAYMKALAKRTWAKSIAVTYYLGVSLFGWLPYYKARKK